MANGAYEGHMTNRKVRGSFLLLEQTKKQKQFGGWKKEKEKKEKRRKRKIKEKKGEKERK